MPQVGQEDVIGFTAQDTIEKAPAHRDRGASAPIRTAWLAVAWVAAGLVLVSTLSLTSVDRAQEARVLETAREMMDAPMRGWMIPLLNGNVRLEKPPLAYWLAAGSFKLFGVHPWAGRLPFALSGWLAVGLVFAFARRLFGPYAALCAAGALLGSMMFAHHARLAETDVLVLLSVTAAVYAFWRAVFSNPADRRWYYAASAAVGLVILSKGIPALFPLLFFLALVWKTKRWDRLWRWVKSGAPPLIGLIAAPWFAYVIHGVGYQTMLREAQVAALGEQHRGSFLTYFPETLVALAPWSGLLVAAVIIAAMRWRKNTRLAVVLLWTAAVIVPLCIAGQKQKHYLMPALPPLAMLIGWFVDRALRAGSRWRFGDLGKIILVATVLVCGAAALGVPVAGRMLREGGHTVVADVLLPLVVIIATATFVSLMRAGRMRAALVVFMVGAIAATTIVDGLWAPSIKPMSPEQIAASIRQRFGDRPCRFYGTPTVPLIFALRQVVPAVATEQELADLATHEPRPLILVPDENADKPSVLPPMLIERAAFKGSDKTVRACEIAPGADTTQPLP